MDSAAEDAGENFSISPAGSVVVAENVPRRRVVYNSRLIDAGNDEAASDPAFKQILDEHFIRFSASYQVQVDRAEDALLHRRLLMKTQDPNKRPAYHIRPLERLSSGADDEDVINSHLRAPSPPKHEITFSTIDQPKLLRKLSTLLYELKLSIRESHIFSTSDGYCLAVFVVDGGSFEDTAGLHEAIDREITRTGGSLAVKSEDWVIDTEHLVIEGQIFDGCFSSLKYGLYLDEEVAVNILATYPPDSISKAQFLHDIHIFRQVQHKNIVRFIGSHARYPDFYIVTEYKRGGSLFDLLHKGGHELSLKQILKFAIDICTRKTHLKTENLLLFADDVVKVDLGTARFQMRDDPFQLIQYENSKRTAPEAFNSFTNTYSLKADIYSFGIVLWELVIAKEPYEGIEPSDVAWNVIMGVRPEIPDNVNPTLSQLMQRCWDADQSKRPEFSEITPELEKLLKHVEDAAAAADAPPHPETN